MNTALALEYLEEFISNVQAAWPVNYCLVSLWNDGALDGAVLALRAGDAGRALAMLAQAAEHAAKPVPTSENRALEAQEERERMALAVRVARALLGGQA